MDWRDSDPEGLRLPIKIDPTSNGEFVPIPLSRANRLGNRPAPAPTPAEPVRIDAASCSAAPAPRRRCWR